MQQPGKRLPPAFAVVVVITKKKESFMRTALVWIQGGSVVDGYLSASVDRGPDATKAEKVKGMPLVDFLGNGRWQFRSVCPAAEVGKGDQFRMAVVLEEP